MVEHAVCVTYTIRFLKKMGVKAPYKEEYGIQLSESQIGECYSLKSVCRCLYSGAHCICLYIYIYICKKTVVHTQNITWLWVSVQEG